MTERPTPWCGSASPSVDDLGNPPLLVVSDLERIEIHTNFTGLSPIVKFVTLDDLAADDPSDALQLLRASSCDH